MQLGVGGRFAGRSFVIGIPPDPALELGEVRFTASVDHATVDSYEVRVREDGSETVAASEDIGKPTPSANNTITVDMTDLFDTLDPGNYTLSVAAIDGVEETDSDPTDAFSLPLS
jgi:hypothetical protein